MFSLLLTLTAKCQYLIRNRFVITLISINKVFLDLLFCFSKKRPISICHFHNIQSTTAQFRPANVTFAFAGSIFTKWPTAIDLSMHSVCNFFFFFTKLRMCLGINYYQNRCRNENTLTNKVVGFIFVIKNTIKIVSTLWNSSLKNSVTSIIIFSKHVLLVTVEEIDHFMVRATKSAKWRKNLAQQK